MRQYGPSCGDAALMEMAVKLAARRQSDNPTVTKKWVNVGICPNVAGNRDKTVQNWLNVGIFAFGVRTRPPRPERRNLNLAFGSAKCRTPNLNPRSGSVRVRTRSEREKVRGFRGLITGPKA